LSGTAVKSTPIVNIRKSWYKNAGGKVIKKKRKRDVKKEEFESLSLRHPQISCGSIHKTRTFDELLEILSIVKV